MASHESDIYEDIKIRVNYFTASEQPRLNTALELAKKANSETDLESWTFAGYMRILPLFPPNTRGNIIEKCLKHELSLGKRSHSSNDSVKDGKTIEIKSSTSNLTQTMNIVQLRKDVDIVYVLFINLDDISCSKIWKLSEDNLSYEFEHGSAAHGSKGSAKEKAVRFQVYNNTDPIKIRFDTYLDNELCERLFK